MTRTFVARIRPHQDRERTGPPTGPAPYAGSVQIAHGTRPGDPATAASGTATPPGFNTPAVLAFEASALALPAALLVGPGAVVPAILGVIGGLVALMLPGMRRAHQRGRGLASAAIVLGVVVASVTLTAVPVSHGL